MLLLGVLQAQAGLITWGYSTDLGGTYTDGWAVRVFEDVNGDGFGPGFTIGVDDVYVNTIETTLITGKQGRYWGLNFNAPAGDLGFSDRHFTVIYNDSVAASATQYIIVDAGTYGLPSSDIDDTYALGSVSGTWQAVPEPTTMALFGIGIVTVAVARKRKKTGKV